MGDILHRISYLRTIAYIVHRDGWIEDPETWRALILKIEEQLSNCLHERLTQTFVDEKSSARWAFENPQDISHDGSLIFSSKGKLGQIINWSFVIETKALGLFGSRNARRSSRGIAQKLFKEFVDRKPQFSIVYDRIVFFSQGVARLDKGIVLLQPKISILAMDLLDESQRRNVYVKAQKWFELEIQMFFSSILSVQQSTALEQLRIILQQSLGIVPRTQIQHIWMKLNKKEKKILERSQIYLGRTHLICKTVFKKRYEPLRVVLLCLFHDISEFPIFPQHSILVDIFLPPKIVSSLGYVTVGDINIRMDTYDRILNELYKDKTSLLPCSWLGCKREKWEQIRKNIKLRKKHSKKKQRHIFHKPKTTQKEEVNHFADAIDEISKQMGFSSSKNKVQKKRKK